MSDEKLRALIAEELEADCSADAVLDALRSEGYLVVGPEEGHRFRVHDIGADGYMLMIYDPGSYRLIPDDREEP